MTRPGHLKTGRVLSRVPFLGRRMFSETKGVGEQCIQPINPTQNGPQADLLSCFGNGEHVTNTCGPKVQNSPLNGYTPGPKQCLAFQGGRRHDVTGQICHRSVRWDRAQHNSVSVNYSLRECSFVGHRHQTETHPFLRKCALDTPTQFRGHGNCGEPVCAEDQQSGSVRVALQHGSNCMEASDAPNSTFKRDSEICTCNGQGALSRCLGRVMQDLNGPSLVHEVMQSTKEEVNKPNTNHFKCQVKVAQVDLNEPGRGTFSSKQSERAIRDQIQRVVANLEEVLHGLKEIHLEMKEVVQKIDLLTADIDICKEEQGDAFRGKMDREVASSQGVKTPTPSVSPPPYPTGDLHEAGQKMETVNSQQHTSGRRSKKPPPYPYASTMGRANPKAKNKGQKTPPYPFKRTLLSTIV
ncbi:uncharacterized protein LOC143735755 [Siphateles boraxobius]|uniref:uncharacterized protein LOC143735755 n=1 Tax=Siphateles boraxobius TaxID=180520 RepID=UPI004062DBED